MMSPIDFAITIQQLRSRKNMMSEGSMARGLLAIPALP
jgi:hypothetical protein